MSSLRILAWTRGYQLPCLRNDLVAGLTLAAYAIPVSLAYAALAGLPPQYGVYCYLVAGPGVSFLLSAEDAEEGRSLPRSDLCSFDVSVM